MNAIRVNGVNAPYQTHLDDMVRTYGAVHVLSAVARTTVRNILTRREKPPDVESLNNRMRRDIGLNPEIDVPTYWDHFR